MNDFDKIKARIKKLLALSGSPNPSEAASALRKAQALMDEYGLGQADANAIDIGEETAPAARRKNPPGFENSLIYQISQAFGCKAIYHIRYGNCVWRFIGLRHRAEVAAYIGQVLLRKLKSARAGYIKSLYRVRSKYRKTQRADDFCRAWVHAVAGKLPAFAGASAEEKKAIELYVSSSHQDLRDVKAIDRSFGHGADYLNGARAGEGVQLRHGVGAHSHGPLLPGA